MAIRGLKKATAVLALLLACAWTPSVRAEEGKTSPEPAPVSPFAPNAQEAPRPDGRKGTLELSNDKTFPGQITLTLGEKLEVFVEKAKRFEGFELKDLARIELSIEHETQEKEWRWKEGGSDEKVFTGRTYVDRKYLMKLTLADGKTVVSGHVKGAPIFVKGADGKNARFILRHDQAGEMGQKPEEVVYVKSVVFDAAESGESKSSAGK
ncbi:MAG: hypothetical protein HY291_18750 [Planctomycetes bacterium]|nr:hypothetical protein [Planctomycetota bacterium]